MTDTERIAELHEPPQATLQRALPLLPAGDEIAPADAENGGDGL